MFGYAEPCWRGNGAVHGSRVKIDLQDKSRTELMFNMTPIDSNSVFRMFVKLVLDSLMMHTFIQSSGGKHITI